MIFADAHVHIYDCYDFQSFMDSALKNFTNAAASAGAFSNFSDFSYVLMLTESARFDYFSRLTEISKQKPGSWHIDHTGEKETLRAVNLKGESIFIISGRQIVTLEKLEVLALLTGEKFKDGLDIKTTISQVHKKGGLAAVPWGFGKWVGRRGKIVDDLIESYGKINFYMGDNGGRPGFLPMPSQFIKARKKKIPVLPGSDPLPFPEEFDRPGNFGFFCRENISGKYPARDLKKIISESQIKLRPYGKPEKPLIFFKNQVRMQIKKHFKSDGKK